VECGALRAAAHLRGLAEGRRVTVRTDPSQDREDRYGRLLAYVRVRGARRTLQEAQLAAGWAAVYVHRRPFARVARFRRAERRARAARRGIHGACGGDVHAPGS
jgi:micrococcal nuclease